MDDFIQLDRDFIQVPDQYAHGAKEDSLDIQAALGFTHGNTKWHDLLKEYRTIILAEAGAGKTQEIRHATQQLQSEGKPAFFLRLENIATDFELAFEIGSYTQFTAWLNTNDEGWLFLDSVDEAKLKNPKDFELALKKLSVQIATAYSRTHVIITSRVSAWRPKSDLNICKIQFPYDVGTVVKFVNDSASEDPINESPHTHDEGIATENNTRDETFKVWSIRNLSKEQVSRFVQHKIVQDTVRFIDEIERQDAWVYTTRPQDLEEIIEYWNTYQKIGSRYEFMEHSIQRRLRERDPDREEIKSISQDKAKQGVLLLAAASTFMHQSSILVPETSAGINGIDCKQILTNWNADECHILLSRPIFDEAIYGTVRFHHRSVREFLTAEWLAEKLKEHGSRQKIENLFFRNQYSTWVIVPSLKPVLSWLALMDEKIMRRVFSLEPEIILQGGDPARLPFEIRKQILHTVCDKMATGITSSSVSDQAAVQRFANQDLATDIRELLTKHKGDTDVIYYLFQLIGQSHSQSLAVEVKSIASDKTAISWVRTSAIRTLKIIGTPENFTSVINDFLHEASKLGREIIAEIVDNLGYTNPESDWIISAIAKAEEQQAHSSEGLGYALSRFVDRAPGDTLTRIVVGIDSLLHQKPFIERTYCHVSERHGWLMPISIQAVEKLVIARHPGALTPASLFALAVAPACADFGEFDISKLEHDLWKLVPDWKEFNHLLFWETVSVVRENTKAENGGRVTHEWQVSWHRPYWSFDEQDFQTIVNDLSSRSFLDDQFVELSLAFKMYVIHKKPRSWLAALKKSVKGNEELEKALHNYLHPPPLSAEAKKYRKQQQQWKRRDNEREEKKKKKHEEAVKWLNEDISDIKGEALSKGSISDRQQWLFRRMQQYNSNNSTKWTSGNWEQLIPDYGIEIAKAFRTGLLNFWRHYTPALRSEFDQDNSIPLAIVFGLSSLDVESSENQKWVDTLNNDEATVACRYAFHDLNDFPAWLPRLYVQFPAIVHQLILQEIDWELAHPDTAGKKLYIVHKVGSYGKWLYDGIAYDLLNRLKTDPPNAEYLAYLLNIIQKSSVISDEQLGGVAAAKCHGSRLIDQLPYWYATWIGIYPRIAIAALTATLNDLHSTDETAAKQMFMRTIVTLVGAEHTRPNAREEFKTAEHLQHLYLLSQQYVRVEEDIKHEGVYSPGLRDDAQDARRMLFGMLKEIKGKASYLAMLELAKFHTTANEKSWMLNNARERAELDADMLPWSSGQFMEFSKDLECIPSNHQELFALAYQRLQDLRYDLEEGDNSVAATLAKEGAETKMRTFIAGWCRDRAAGRYTIAQEDELADAKKPDIRFFSPLVSGPVAVELKLAEKWTGPELFERLQNQLCRDYLRDVKSGHGIFALVYRGAGKQKWELSGSGKEVSFTELVQHLQDHWESISNTFPGIERISVIGIDLTKRIPSRGKKSQP